MLLISSNGYIFTDGVLLCIFGSGALPWCIWYDMEGVNFFTHFPQLYIKW